MNLDLDELLEDEKYLEKLSKYIHVKPDEYDIIPKFSFIMYIDRDGSVKPGGFLIRYYPGQRPDEKRFLLKINGSFQSLYPFFYHIFYKPTSEFDKSTKKDIKDIKVKKIKTFLNKISD